MQQVTTEFAVVRMNRMEAGTNQLPADHPRRCRYYIRAASDDEMLAVCSKRWPGEYVNVLESHTVPVRVWK